MDINYHTYYNICYRNKIKVLCVNICLVCPGLIKESVGATWMNLSTCAEIQPVRTSSSFQRK